MRDQLLVEARGVRYRYEDGTPALEGVDFELRRNETVALFGPNGSGKTTFVLLLNGLLTGEGEIRVCGLRVERKNLPVIRRKVGVVFQDPEEQLFMPTVLEDVAFGLLSQGIERERALKAATGALEKVGMKHNSNRAPYHLSAGEKRRATLAGVLVMKPEILILDEPTTFLDPPGQRDLIHLLEELPQSKIVVTHDTCFARALAQRAVFFEKGRVTGAGAVEDIARRFDWDSRPAR
ncbi:MAG: ABC transporter ATP-binding protein [Acidobacteria bacterium]|nr:ABC transporter ATP-binding protein [Acidobacteriota bacterium]